MSFIRNLAVLAAFGLLSSAAQAQGIFNWNLPGLNNNNQNNNSCSTCGPCGPNGCRVPNSNSGGMAPQWNPMTPGSQQPYVTNRPSLPTYQPGYQPGYQQPNRNEIAPYFNEQFDSFQNRVDERRQRGPHNSWNGNAPQFQQPGQFPQSYPAQPMNRPFNQAPGQYQQPLPGNPMFTGVMHPVQPAGGALSQRKMNDLLLN